MSEADFRPLSDEELANQAGARVATLTERQLEAQAARTPMSEGVSMAQPETYSQSGPGIEAHTQVVENYTPIPDVPQAGSGSSSVDADVGGGDVEPQVIEIPAGLPGAATVGGGQEGVVVSAVEQPGVSLSASEHALSRSQKFIARKLEEWRNLPEAEKTQKVERIVDFIRTRFRSQEGDVLQPGIVERMLKQLAAIIESDVIPGIEPFTKGVFMIAFRSRGLPLRVALPLASYFGEMISKGIERNAQRGADLLRSMSEAMDNNNATPEEKALFDEIVAKASVQQEKNESDERMYNSGAGGVIGSMDEMGADQQVGPVRPAQEKNEEESVDEPDFGSDDGGVSSGNGGGSGGGGDDELPPDEAADPENDNENEEEKNKRRKKRRDAIRKRLSEQALPSGDLSGSESETSQEASKKPEVLDPTDPKDLNELMERKIDEIDEENRERYEVEREMQEARYAIGFPKKKPGMSDEDFQRLEHLVTQSAKAWVENKYGRKVQSVLIGKQLRYYIEYDVMDRQDCEDFGEHSRSIVVQLNRAGLLSNFDDDEVGVIRSFDANHLHPPETPERFVKAFGKMVKDATDETTGLDQSALDKSYESYKQTLMRVMYLLIGDKVMDEEKQSAPPTLAKAIQDRLAALKGDTKYTTADDDKLLNNATFTLRQRRRVVPDSELALGMGSDKTVFAEYDVQLPISKVIGEDLIPTLQDIEYSVVRANMFREQLHNPGKSLTDMVASVRGIEMAKIPEAIAHNEYVQYAMQEYARALGQAVAEANHLPQSNFLRKNASGLDRAEELTVQSLLLRFPPPGPPEGDFDQEYNRILKREMERWISTHKPDEAFPEGEQARLRKNLEKEFTNRAARRQKRYESDIEAAVKIAAGLHVGFGEYWSILDASIGDEVLTSTVMKDGKLVSVRDFQDLNSPVLAKLMEIRSVEGSRFGKEDGLGLMGVAAARYPGEIIERQRRKGLLGRVMARFRRTPSVRIPSDPEKEGVIARTLRGLDIIDLAEVNRQSDEFMKALHGQRSIPDAHTQSDYLKLTRDMLSAERNGMTSDLEEFYRNSLSIRQILHVPPGDIPRSGGWRVENDDGFERRYVSQFEAEAKKRSLVGNDAHEFIIGELRALGGERLVIHYIGKKVGAMMKDDPQFSAFIKEYDAVKTRIEKTILDGTYARSEGAKTDDENTLEIMTPMLNRYKDDARAKYLQKYVTAPLLAQHPEMTLLMERKALTPEGENTMRDQIVESLKGIAENHPDYISRDVLPIGKDGDDKRLEYAMRYVCMPLFEMAYRAEQNLPKGLQKDTALQQMAERRHALFRDQIKQSTAISIIPGQPSQNHPSLSEILVGDGVDGKVDSLEEMYKLFKGSIDTHMQTHLDTYAQRFAMDIVLGRGKTDAMLTSGGGFDYSRFTFEGLSTIKSALGGVEVDKELKGELVKIEKALFEIYRAEKFDIKSHVSALKDLLQGAASKLTGNPDEANVHYARLAEICVFSLRAPSAGDREPSIWNSTVTQDVSHGLNADQRRSLLQALLRATNAFPDRLIYIDRLGAEGDVYKGTGSAQRAFALALQNLSPESDRSDGSSPRSRAAAKLLQGGSFKPKMASITIGMVMRDCMRSSSQDAVLEQLANLKKDDGK